MLRQIDVSANRYGCARITVKPEIEGIDSIARIFEFENHMTFWGRPANVMESIFFGPIWIPTSIYSLYQGKGWNPIPMNVDKVSADSRAFGYRGGGDAGRGRVEHRSFLSWVHSFNCKKQVIQSSA